MLGIIIQLSLSWLLLSLFQKNNLSVLGLAPDKMRIKQFTIGLFIPIIYFVLLFLLLAQLGKNPYRINEHYTWNNFLQGTWYLFKSVAFETLIFNGALLYILVQRIGTNKAVLISAVAFGIYHWFSWNLFSQPITMLIVFLTTGVAGYFWSWAYVKTGSIWLPFALHYGVDFTLNIIFSKDKALGNQLFVQTFTNNPATPGIIVSVLLILLYYTGFPILMWLYLKTFTKSTMLNDIPIVQVSDTTGAAMKN